MFFTSPSLTTWRENFHKSEELSAEILLRKLWHNKSVLPCSKKRSSRLYKKEAQWSWNNHWRNQPIGRHQWNQLQEGEQPKSSSLSSTIANTYNDVWKLCKLQNQNHLKILVRHNPYLATPMVYAQTFSWVSKQFGIFQRIYKRHRKE